MNFDGIISRIAKEWCISKKDVLNNMQQVIDEAYGNPDPKIRAEWAAFGHKPTPKEFLLYMCSQRIPTDGFAEQNGRDAERAD